MRMWQVAPRLILRVLMIYARSGRVDRYDGVVYASAR